MNIFNSTPIITYKSSYHAEERIIERTGCDWVVAKQTVEQLAYDGELIIEVDKYRYLKSGDLFLPCIQDRNYENGYDYVVKSVLTWDMVFYRLQEIIDKYNLYNTFE